MGISLTSEGWAGGVMHRRWPSRFRAGLSIAAVARGAEDYLPKPPVLSGKSDATLSFWSRCGFGRRAGLLV